MLREKRHGAGFDVLAQPSRKTSTPPLRWLAVDPGSGSDWSAWTIVERSTDWATGKVLTRALSSYPSEQAADAALRRMVVTDD